MSGMASPLTDAPIVPPKRLSQRNAVHALRNYAGRIRRSSAMRQIFRAATDTVSIIARSSIFRCRPSRTIDSP